MGDLGKLESIIIFQIGILQELVDSYELQKDLEMLKTPIEEKEKEKEKEISKINNESLLFFKNKLEVIKKVKEEMHKFILD